MGRNLTAKQLLIISALLLGLTTVGIVAYLRQSEPNDKTFAVDSLFTNAVIGNIAVSLPAGESYPLPKYTPPPVSPKASVSAGGGSFFTFGYRNHSRDLCPPEMYIELENYVRQTLQENKVRAVETHLRDVVTEENAEEVSASQAKADKEANMTIQINVSPFRLNDGNLLITTNAIVTRKAWLTQTSHLPFNATTSFLYGPEQVTRKDFKPAVFNQIRQLTKQIISSYQSANQQQQAINIPR